MMPQLVTVRVDRRDRRTVRLWLPVLPVALLLSPLLLLGAVGAIVACLYFRVRVLRAFHTGWRIFVALPGARFGLAEGPAGVHVSVH
jgi:hypothetical protein